jgi:transposase
LIRVDNLWLATEPLDMRSGTEAALARVVSVFGAARPHHAYLFANRRANRMKVLVHDGIGVWLAARRLNSGRFVWPRDANTLRGQAMAHPCLLPPLQRLPGLRFLAHSFGWPASSVRDRARERPGVAYQRGPRADAG